MLRQALRDGVAGEQAGRDQHAGVRGVGAGGDGGDHDVAMAEVEVLAFDLDALGAFARLLVFALERGRKTALDAGQRDAAFGTLRAGHRRHDRAEVEFERVGEHRIGGAGFAAQALRLGIGLDQRDAVFLAARHA